MSFYYLKYCFSRIRRVAAIAVVGVSLAGLSACGGGGGSSDSAATGSLAIGITDAPGDFVTYTVDVVSIKLTHADGRVVETMPLSTRVDFAQYTDLTEFLTAATVPLGRYVKATMTLDYSNANIVVEDANGAAIPVTIILDANNQPITAPLEVNVDLSGNRAVPIAPGLIRYLSLDFNLAQTNQVTLGTDSATINVEPVLIADVDHESPKHHRIRGPLQAVDVANSSYDIFIHPFLKRLGNNENRFGTFTITTSNATLFEINGQTYQGSDGLTLLATLPKFTAVVSIGKLKMNPLRFEADQVYAGSSVPGGSMDVVQGSVVARSGNVLTVNGATLVRTDGTVSFGDNAKVELFASTTVTKALTMGTFPIDDISVGQRVMVFGVMTTDTGGNPILSTANGYARMEISGVRGNVTAIPDASHDHMILSLTSINGRNPLLYNFTGTQATANNYEIDTGTLGLTGVSVDNDVNLRGLVTPFGSGPLDFTAQTVINNTTGVTIE
jgi:Domain of unknown function (DUF4382)